MKSTRAIKTFTQAELSLSRSKPISCESIILRKNVALHRHDFTEVVIILQGTASHKTVAGSALLKSGLAIVCPRGTCHGFQNSRDLKLVNLYFIDEWLTGVVPRLLEEKSFGQLFLPSYTAQHFSVEPTLVQLTRRSMQNIAAETDDIEQELAEATPDALCLRLSLLKILGVICKDYRNQDGAARHTVYRHEITKAFEMIDSAIVQGLPINIGSIAKRVALSTDHFTRIFGNSVGINPGEYAARRRVDLAAAALLNTDKSLTEIALDLGYYDAAHFSHSFLGYKKLSPLAFRKSFAEKKPSGAF